MKKNTITLTKKVNNKFVAMEKFTKFKFVIRKTKVKFRTLVYMVLEMIFKIYDKLIIIEKCKK